MSRIVLDPTAELTPGQRPRLPRPASLEHVTVGLLDIAKPRSDVFLERVDQLLRQRGVRTRRYRKPTFAKPAPAALRQQITIQCGAIIEALAD